MAIASIVGASVFGFMTVGAKTFSNNSTDVHIQNEAQLAFNQIQDLVIDTVVGIDYVYITGGNYSDDSNKVITDSEIPAGVDGKKLIMYNTSTSGRNIYEVVWKAAEKKLYYNEYSVAVDSTGGVDKVVKGTQIGQPDALMAEFVTGFSADLSQVETKRVAKIDISYEKDGRPYTSSHNITLRNKIVSGNEIPQFIVSENNISLSKVIEGPDEIYVEPGDYCQVNNSYTVKDVEGNVTSATKNWSMPADVQAAGNSISLDGKLQVTNTQKDDFTITVQSGDGLANKTVNVKIMRIRSIDGVNWRHIGSIGKGEINNNSIPSEDDLIADERFELSVPESLISGSNLDETSFNGKTIEKKVIFIKTKGEELFEITSQNGNTCECKMKDNISKSAIPGVSWVSKNSPSSKKYNDAEIEVTAVSIYSMGGRGFNASSITNPDLSLSDFDYTSSSTQPSSAVGASSYLAANRYYEGPAAAPVKGIWAGHAYLVDSSFKITESDADMQRGQHYPVDIECNGRKGSLDVLTKASNGDTINPNDYCCVVDIKLTERLYKDDGTGVPYVDTTVYPYCDRKLVGGNAAYWGFTCPERFNPNAEYKYELTYYLFKKSSASGSITKDMMHKTTYVRMWNESIASRTVYANDEAGGEGPAVNLSPDDLGKYDYVSEQLPLTFSRLKLTYNKDASESRFVITGDNNTQGAQHVSFYPKPFGVEKNGDNQTTKLTFTCSNQFKTPHNRMKLNFYKENNGWVPYEEGDRLYEEGNRLLNGAVGDKEVKFENYIAKKFTKNTPKHLRAVPAFKYNEKLDGTGEEKYAPLFDSYIDVWLWNIEIPKYTGTDKWSNRITTVDDVSYFPVPTDTGFKDLVSSEKKIWKGALWKDNNTNARIYYTLSKIGEVDIEKPSYRLKLYYLNHGTYTIIKEYECGYDDHEWTMK